MDAIKEPFCLLPGTLLGENFQIIKQIGKGGMGHVYLAYDTRLEIQVAIKVISPEFSESMETSEYETVVRRFESEAKIAAKIDHPNVIRIYGFKREPLIIDGNSYEIDYLVMEHLAGRTLRNTMDVSGFEHEEEIKDWLLKYMLPILDGLQKVHENGIIHRDIKPENFLMKDEVPKLADFGLSMAIDLPSVTGSIADIFGTVTYMAPEQYYNFSLAKETADIYAIGKILYEIVEGKISDKSIPFKQVQLHNQESEFLVTLNRIIMSATEENPNRRTPTAIQLKDQIIKLLASKTDGTGKDPKAISQSFAAKFAGLSALVFALVGGAALLLNFYLPLEPATRPPLAQTEQTVDPVFVEYLPFTNSLKRTIRSKDNSTMHLIPPAVLQLEENNPLGVDKITVAPFYLSESPITNQQYVTFLNDVKDQVRVEGTDVYYGEQLILKLSEKIRGYKPIVYENGRFVLRNPMHAACAVLNVTGHGATAFARHYGMRLPTASEWLYVMKTGEQKALSPMDLPIPVITYEQDKYGLRGINQIAEWGMTQATEFAIFGQSPSDMIQDELVVIKDPTKYYTDTGFRIAADTPKIDGINRINPDLAP